MNTRENKQCGKNLPILYYTEANVNNIDNKMIKGPNLVANNLGQTNVSYLTYLTIYWRTRWWMF